MSSFIWPSNIQLPSGCDEAPEDPALRSEMESGTVKTRARYTRIRQIWQLSWANMRGPHYRILRAFYTQVRGGSVSFSWTHPVELTTFNVRFKGQFSSRHTVRDCWNVTLTLEQV